MKSKVLSAILLLLLAALSGCTATESDDSSNDEGGTEDSEVITFNHQFEVIEVAGVTGPYSGSFCGYEDEEECHVFVVSISNIGTDNLSIIPSYWSAIGDDGLIYTTSTADGLSKIIPGATTELTLGFGVKNGVKLTTLRFNLMILDSDYNWILDSIYIPSYDIVQSFNVTLNVSASSAEDDGEGCGYGEDEECHTLNITVTNDGLLDFSSNNKFYWVATGNDGIIYEGPDRGGADEVVAGSAGIVILSFDVPDGVKLTSLQWDDHTNSLNYSIPIY